MNIGLERRMNLSLQLILEIQKQRMKKIQFASPFLEKTYSLLENPELESIISWNSDGTLILIHSIDGLSNILPRYFKHKKIQSFIRQLNIYNFKKVKKSVAINAFRHPNFKRDDFSNFHLIKRRVKSLKSSTSVSTSSDHSCRRSLENNQECSEKISDFQENQIKPLQNINITCSLGSEQEGFNYLVQDDLMPINHSYYDWEDIFE